MNRIDYTPENRMNLNYSLLVSYRQRSNHLAYITWTHTRIANELNEITTEHKTKKNDFNKNVDARGGGGGGGCGGN